MVASEERGDERSDVGESIRVRVGRTWGAVALAVGALTAGGSLQAAERRAEVAARASFTDYSQFDESDIGFGGDFSFRLTGWLAADAQLTYSPSDLGEPASFSASRFEGLFGLRGGHRFGRAGVYAAARPGFVEFGEPSGPFACITIFPPPLECTIGGETVFALNYGAGLEFFPGDRVVIRAEVGDLLLKYSGPAFDKDMEVFEEDLWSHNLRVSASIGLRF